MRSVWRHVLCVINGMKLDGMYPKLKSPRHSQDHKVICVGLLFQFSDDECFLAHRSFLSDAADGIAFVISSHPGVGDAGGGLGLRACTGVFHCC